MSERDGVARLVGEWRFSTWGDEVTLNYGKAIRGYQSATGPYRVYGSNGPVGWHSEPLSQGPGVILGRKGAYRGVRFSPHPFYVIDTAYYVVPKAEMDMRWLYYAIVHHRLGEIDDGSPIPSTTRAAVYVRELEIPSYPEQQTIASALSSLDDKIELNRRMNETLEGQAQAIFRDWFVDFGPVRRAQAGEADPVAIMGGLTLDAPAKVGTGFASGASTQSTPARAAHLAALFPAAFGDDGLPVGWQRLSLADIAVQGKGSINPLRQPDTIFEHYSLPAFDKGQEPAIDAGSTIKSNKTPVPQGAILLSKLNPETLRVWLPNDRANVAQIASTEFLVFAPKAGASRSLLFALFRDPDFRTLMQGMVTGTSKSHQRISPPALLAQEVLSADQALFPAFAAFVEPMLERLLASRAENRALAETRDYLLPRLMSGAVRVAASQEAA